MRQRRILLIPKNLRRVELIADEAVNSGLSAKALAARIVQAAEDSGDMTTLSLIRDTEWLLMHKRVHAFYGEVLDYLLLSASEEHGARIEARRQQKIERGG